MHRPTADITNKYQNQMQAFDENEEEDEYGSDQEENERRRSMKMQRNAY